MRFMLGFAIAFCSVGGSASAADDAADLFRKYRGKEAVPDGLRKAYTAFANQTRDGSVESFLLPHAPIAITREPRPEKDREYGRDINVPFLRNGFSATVLNVRKDPDDCYLIRTGSSAIWRVETKSGVWRIYSYFDKPIE